MTSVTAEYRLYRDLASWWPLISPPQEYTEEAVYLSALLCTLTLVDISPDMLEVSRRLNPECEHRLGDMRAIRLAESFDAVLVHDAIDYITSQDELRQVIGTAFAHCKPGGIALFVPDHVADTFAELTGSGGGATDADGRRGSFQERTWDPDPCDDWVQAEYQFTLRAADGTTEVVRETHRLGSFSEDTWQRALSQAGFEGLPGEWAALPGRGPDNLFACRRPAL
jgi:SAM-dependent methyltransferase